MPFMNKSHSHAHRKRIWLRNCCLKKRSEQNRLSHVKQVITAFLFQGKPKKIIIQT